MREQLLRDLQKAKGINGLRGICQTYLSPSFRRALTAKVPEFYLSYYLGFRLPQHQINWIHMWQAVKNLLELAPRDHGKSWIFSFGMPLYEIYASYARTNLRSVDARILQISKTDTQAGKFAGQVKRTIESNRLLLADFGDIRDMTEWSKGHFRCKRDIGYGADEKDHTYEKTGVLGSITGGHFYRVTLDDPVDDENTKTKERLKSIEDWFWGTIWNLRENYTKYAIVGTRKKRLDLYNQILQSPTWVSNEERAIMKYPMIPDPDKSGQMKNGWLYITNKGRHISHQVDLKMAEKIVDVELLTDDYEVLWPPAPAVNNDGDPITDPETGRPIMFGWGIKELLLDRATQGSVYFDREKQNMVSAEEGAIFNKAWFRFFKNEELIFNSNDNYYYLETDLAAANNN